MGPRGRVTIGLGPDTDINNRYSDKISVDDFGTGESTLRYLHRFPVDTLKIDRSFIQPLVDDDDGRFIVQSVIELANRMGLRTVAEGVETAAHAAILTELGADLAQGYHFARPLDPLAFEEHDARNGSGHPCCPGTEPRRPRSERYAR